MATEYLYLRGKAKWPQLTKPDDKYDNFKINVYLDDESMNLFSESGIQLTPKTDEDGTYVVFRRPNYKQLKKELVHFGAPKVIDGDGAPVTVAIGNGSDVVVKIVVYDSKKGKGHRLEAVQVVNLIPYEGGSGNGSSSNATVKAVAGVEAF
jgi:hypothetical protein